MAKALTPEMRKVESERERRLKQRGLTDTSLLKPFEGFPWEEISKVRDQAKEQRQQGAQPQK